MNRARTTVRRGVDNPDEMMKNGKWLLFGEFFRAGLQHVRTDSVCGYFIIQEKTGKGTSCASKAVGTYEMVIFDGTRAGSVIGCDK